MWSGEMAYYLPLTNIKWNVTQKIKIKVLFKYYFYLNSKYLKLSFIEIINYKVIIIIFSQNYLWREYIYKWAMSE